MTVTWCLFRVTGLGEEALRWEVMPGTLVSGSTAHRFAGNGVGERQSRKGQMTFPGKKPCVCGSRQKGAQGVRNACFTSDVPWLSGFSLAHRKEGPTKPHESLSATGPRPVLQVRASECGAKVEVTSALAAVRGHQVPPCTRRHGAGTVTGKPVWVTCLPVEHNLTLK